MNTRGNVTKGSMWDTPKIAYSKETGDLLKTMMKESRLNNFQQRQLREALSSGNTLPTRVHPTSSRKKEISVPLTSARKTVDPRNYAYQVRKKETIENSGAYERDQFHPKPMTKYGGVYSKEKERLSNIMAYGEDVAPTDVAKAFRRGVSSPKTKVDRFEELVKEIDERKEFLTTMTDIGKGGQYKTIIDTEISLVRRRLTNIMITPVSPSSSFQLVREMEMLDKKRNTELEERLKTTAAD